MPPLAPLLLPATAGSVTSTGIAVPARPLQWRPRAAYCSPDSRSPETQRAGDAASPAAREQAPAAASSAFDWSDAASRTVSRAIATGDPAALETLYRAWMPRALRLITGVTGRDESFVLDVLHDATLRVARSLPPLDSVRALEAWLSRTACACALDRLRAESRRARRERRRARASGAADAVSSAPASEQLEVLERCVRRLDPAEFALLRARLDAGLTLAQIARAWGGSPGAVHGMIRRAIARVRSRSSEVFRE